MSLTHACNRSENGRLTVLVHHLKPVWWLFVTTKKYIMWNSNQIALAVQKNNIVYDHMPRRRAWSNTVVVVVIVIVFNVFGFSTLLYLKFLVLWALVLFADFILEFRFEFLWPFWLLLRSVYDSFKYQGLVSILYIKHYALWLLIKVIHLYVFLLEFGHWAVFRPCI